ncbi:S8 family serine peptidase [Rossellomorea sp. GAMAL-10_SWC]
MKITKKLLALSTTCLLTISSFVGPVGNYGKAYASKNNMNSNNLEAKEVIENKISPELEKEFDNKSQNSFLVKFKDQVDTVKVANEAKAKNKQLSNVKKELVVRSSIVSELRIKADSSQSNLKKYLVKEKNNGNVKDIKSFYIVNGMAVTATEDVMKNIAAMPEVESIKPNGITKLIHPEKTTGAAVQADENTEWGLKKIGAPDVWSLGIDGTGIVVGSIDTGVQWDHPALKTKYRGYDPNNPDNPNNEFNWFDATETHGSVPYDDLGHGTHTVGTMVGSEPNGTNKIGVAPGAKWIAAKAFTKDGGNDADLIAAGEWMLAPKDRNGVPHPEMAPNVINNSWGGGPGVDDWYRTIIRNWRAANIVPVFAAGNITPSNPGGPGSVANPGNYPESFTVGATDINNNLAGFSLRGPSPYGGIIKPNVSAPGVNIRSSVPGSVYEGGWNGTSMATPHTSGLVALLLQANSSLKVDDIERIIENTATPCTNTQYPETPNNGYGSGVINAFKAVTSVMQGISEIKGQVSQEAEDTVPPTFKHLPVTETYEGLKQDLKIDVQDNVSVETVELQYKNSADEWTTVVAKRISGDYKSGSYEAVIPADRVVGSNLSYRWRIVDFGKNEVTSDIYKILVKPALTIGYFNDFETEMTGWEGISQVPDQLKWGKPTTGPKAAASGEKVLATNLEGTYSGNQSMVSKMPAIVLPEGKAYLQFKNWYDIGENDHGFVAVKPDGAEYFDIEAAYVGTTAEGYSNEEIDLSKYAGKKIEIAFAFISGDSNNHQGWFIDDVKLTNKSAATGSTSSALSNIPKELMNRLTNLFATSGGKSALSNSPKEQIINSVETNSDTAGLPLLATVSIVENGRSTKTNPQDGSYSFKIKAGEYTLRAETYGYYPQDQKVQVTENQVLENTNFTMVPLPKGTLKGKIINAQTGKPVKGAKVYVIEDAAVSPVTTDAEGNYSLTAYEGKYTVQVTAENYFDEKFTVDITGNENVSHDLQLKPFINFPGEIGYDDGTGEYSVAQWEAGGGYAVRMSLPEGQTSAIVTSGLFMIDPFSGGNTFKVAVYDASGKDGAPGKIIAGPINATAVREAGKWTVVDLSAQQIVVTGDFYMVLIQDKFAPASPAIMLDKNNPVVAQRSWWFVKGGPFTLANKDFGNMMIRSTVKLEAKSPVIVSSLDNSYFNNENVTIKGMAAPGMDVHIFRNDEDIANGKTNNDGSFSIDTVLQEGVNTLKAKTITEIGSTPYSKEIKVIVDKTAPALDITSPQNNANINDQVITVTGTAKDDYLDYVNVNGTRVDIDSNGNWTAKLISKEGKNGINVVARDKAGNETVKSLTVNVKYAITGITNLKPDQDLKLKSGDAVKVEFDSEVGLKKAAFRIILPIGNVNGSMSIQTTTGSAIEMPMIEKLDVAGKGTGHYVGQWIVPKDIVLNGGQIEVTVEDNNGNKMTMLTKGRLYINSKVVKPAPPAKPAPIVAADKKDNKVGKTINITFKDDAKWRSSITSITVNGKSIKVNYKIDKGNIIINGKVFTKTQSYKIVIKAKGYKDVQVTQVIIPEVKPAPKLTADKKDNKVGKTINITFKDDAKWRSSITSITVNGKSIKGNYKIDKGNIIINGKVFTKAQSYKIVIKAKGYKDVQVTQVIVKK